MVRFHFFFNGRVVCYSSTNGHLGCFYFMTIVNNDTVNTRTHIAFPISVFMFFGQISKSEIVGLYGEGNGNPLQSSCLENPRDGGAWWAAVYGVAQGWTRLKQLSSSSSSMVVLFLIFWGTSKLFSIVAAPVYIPTNSAQGIRFLYISVITYYFLSFRKQPFALVWGISHCDFDLHFSDDQEGEYITYVLSIYYVSLENFLFRSSAPFSVRLLRIFFVCFLLSCMSSSYILGINSSDIWFINIFSSSVGCHFILLMVSFAVQKLFILV